MSASAPPGIFTTQAAIRAGITVNELRGPRFRRLEHGVYTSADTEIRLVERAAAALTVMPSDAVLTGVTMLHLHGVEVGDPLPVRVVTATDGQSRRAGVRLGRVKTLPERRRRMATPTAAWLAACTEFDLLQAVTAADWIIHARLATRVDLLTAAAGARGRGCRAIRRAAGLSRQHVESPRETRLRLCLVLAGLPTPACNVTIGDEFRPIGRVDLLYEEFKTLLEYDGDQHRVDRAQWNLDLDRNDAFADCGYQTIRVTAARMRRPREVVRRAFSALTAHGYAGPPPVFSAEWSALFERRL